MHRLSLTTCVFILSFIYLFHVGEVDARPSPATSRSHKRKVDANGYELDIVQIDSDSASHNRDFFKFVTRPDIDAPRWNIEIHDPEAVSPGYWFVGPYQNRIQHERGGGWVGPHIYDGRGELVWSGVPHFKGFDTFDFKAANVGSQDMITLVYRHENAIILDNSYNVHRKLNISDDAAELNMHDFNVVDNGKSALLLKTIAREATPEESDAVGFSGNCNTRFYGFEELNTTTWESIFSWTSEGNIALEESKNRRKKCRSTDGYDYIHANAIDKFPDGDYLLNARNTNAMYKISAKDGSVVWRFGGKKSDFEFNDHFSGQHNARVQMQNSTHTLISFLDNAFAPSQHPVHTNDYSRGLLVSLRTDKSPMTAEILERYDHPLGEYAPGRGSYQILPNGNTFVGWTTSSLHSEYGPGGSLVMQASLKPKLKSYRSYKFPWVGRPTQPPDVQSIAATSQDEFVTTVVFVSWNGATEVQSWNLYKTNADGTTMELIASTLRQGFETELAYEGFASYVVAEAIDRNGKPLGRSEVAKTRPPSDRLNPDVLDETEWTQDHSPTSGYTGARGLGILSNPVFAFVCGIICCVVAGLLGVATWKLRSRPEASSWWTQKPSTMYQYLLGKEGELEDDDEIDEVQAEVDKC